MMLSDIEEGNTNGPCRDCGKPSFYWIEIEHEDGYRDRGLYCRTHGDETLALLRNLHEQEKAAHAALTVRLGFDPHVFCERCGYRACRCYHDHLTDAPVLILTAGDSWENVG
jgi:ribosomal protein L37E